MHAYTPKNRATFRSARRPTTTAHVHDKEANDKLDGEGRTEGLCGSRSRSRDDVMRWSGVLTSAIRGPSNRIDARRRGSAGNSQADIAENVGSASTRRRGLVPR
eukprot:NODE_12211_length_519_cov_88.472222_g11922_i0.p1 GENE.NODE_12211_length_519_cov_88.472222_g11922_i0~~NODE_12211_length_519_cov_88.472222_g11922_i0.p1  ORF type:complete len:104 (-),score=3.47 NODE_12211_length_519_cov_88.472222_g11922_i0:65-376(-)